MKLQGRVALITGGNQGLGKTIAQHFLAEGASVILCARNAQMLEKARQELAAHVRDGQQLLAQVTDIAQTEQVDALVASVLDQFSRLDILVNNAGVYGPKGSIEEIDWQEWVQAVNINLLGSVYMCRAVLPHFKERGYGKIINLSGGGATSPLPRLSAYAASKAALVRFTETLARELDGSGIDVNAIAPGALNTRLLDEILEAGPEKVGEEFYRKSRKQKTEGGTPLEKGAALAVFLAAAASDGISGKLISAVWDPWAQLPDHLEELKSSDIYALRRIVPEDRGMDWGG